eukprot:Polyplicarium_translucidae@DN3121_c0_g1_i10.p3
MKYAQLVIGPAGCGKSTYCATIQKHCQATKRIAKVVNFDPAAEEFTYDCDTDIRDLVSVADVMEELELGPNGALVYAMEYLLDNLDWLEENLDYGDDTYVIFDCPGQVELYSHLPVMKCLVDELGRLDFRIAGVYCMDVSFMTDGAKFVAGSLAALSAMICLEIPHINILTKCDLVEDEVIDSVLEKSPTELASDLHKALPKRYRAVNDALGALLQDYSVVGFVPLNSNDEESIGSVLLAVDMAIQYGEDLEPNTNLDTQGEEAD